MLRIIGWVIALAVVLGAIGGVYWIGAREGWFGSERDAGVIQGKRIPDEIISARTQ